MKTSGGNTKSPSKPSRTVTIGGSHYEQTEHGILLGGGGATEAGWHSIEDFLRCPKEYQFRHIRKIHAPQQQMPDHFALGIMFHAGRARWFANNFDASEKGWASIYKAVREAAMEGGLPVSVKAEQAALRHLQAYVSHYSALPRPSPVAAEYKLGPVALNKGDPFPLWRTARLDDVSHYPEAGGKLCIGESKTSGSTVNDTVSQYTLHGQTMMQALLWKNDPNGEAKHGPIAGILLDVTVKSYDANRPPTFGRSFIPITDFQLNWFAQSIVGYIRASIGTDRNATVPRNPSACTRLIGRGRLPCEFRDLCRFGASATARYVIENGQSLKEWAKKHPSEVAPWE